YQIVHKAGTQTIPQFGGFANREGGFPNWLPRLDSNQEQRLQRALCYRYTTGYPDLGFRFANFASGAISKVYSVNGDSGAPAIWRSRCSKGKCRATSRQNHG